MKILITGASKGLGLSIANLLSEQNEVIGCARSFEFPGAAFTYIGGVDLALADTFNLLPLAECDVLINNAAIASDGLLATQSELSIREVIDVNLTGTLLLTKKWVRARLTKQKSGCIVNISSIIGMRGYAGLAAYSATKAGLDGITRALARELGPKRFRVNSVLPGYVETDMSRILTVPQRDQIIRRTPLGRLATASDISSVVAFLVSPAAGFITGQCITVDGGICV